MPKIKKILSFNNSNFMPINKRILVSELILVFWISISLRLKYSYKQKEFLHENFPKRKKHNFQ